MALAQVWTPGHSYRAGEMVCWQGYLLRCRWDHTVPTHAEDPWYQAEPGQALRPRLRRWLVAYDEMKATNPGDIAA